MTEDAHNHRLDVSDQERMQALLERLTSYIEQYHGGLERLAALFGPRAAGGGGGGRGAGCPRSATTLQGWVAGTVRHFFPNLEKTDLARRVAPRALHIPQDKPGKT